MHWLCCGGLQAAGAPAMQTYRFRTAQLHAWPLRATCARDVQCAEGSARYQVTCHCRAAAIGTSPSSTPHREHVARRAARAARLRSRQQCPLRRLQSARGRGCCSRRTTPAARRSLTVARRSSTRSARTVARPSAPTWAGSTRQTRIGALRWSASMPTSRQGMRVPCWSEWVLFLSRKPFVMP